MKRLFLLLIPVAFLVACDSKEPVEPPATYDATPYALQYGDFPPPVLPDDNKPTVAGVQLGRMLFYEKMLSKDGTQACADCHVQGDAFSDIRRFSIGVEGLPGKRQAMPVMNLAWHRNGLFWDGRAPLLRDQALKPIQDPLEMNETLPNAVAKLAADKRYTDQFVRAFGEADITPERMALALEQFMLSVVSHDSKWDKYKRGEVTLSDSEERGRVLFFAEFDPFGTERGAECFHCHGGFNFTNDEFMNNGLDPDAAQTDPGRRSVSGNAADMAKFKVPSLRNIALTAPYMHDGRFSTLEAVIDHYNTGVQQSATMDELLQYNVQPGGLQLSAQDKADLVAFLQTLSDPSFLANQAYRSPF
jgi:cytochrome c peroxidase